MGVADAPPWSTTPPRWPPDGTPRCEGCRCGSRPRPAGNRSGRGLPCGSLAPESPPMMNQLSLVVLLLASCAPVAAPGAPVPEPTRWERHAQQVTIVRDDWGIAHIHGKTDADAVFGMIYAQAEDDFHRVETNY